APHRKTSGRWPQRVSSSVAPAPPNAKNMPPTTSSARHVSTVASAARTPARLWPLRDGTAQHAKALEAVPAPCRYGLSIGPQTDGAVASGTLPCMHEHLWHALQPRAARSHGFDGGGAGQVAAGGGSAGQRQAIPFSAYSPVCRSPAPRTTDASATGPAADGSA